MDRRTILRTTPVALGALFAGCLGGAGTTNDPTTARTTETQDTTTAEPENTPVSCESNGATTTPEPPSEWDSECGPAATPVSERLVRDVEESDSGATPAFLVANEREAAVKATVSVSGTDIQNETYQLSAGGQALEQEAFKTTDGTTVTVEVDGTEYTGTWSAQSWYRPAVVIGSDGIDAGWLEPLTGLNPGHSCYAGDPARLRIDNERSSPVSMTVSLTRPCTDTTQTESFELVGDDAWGSDDLLVSGERYLGTISIEDGPTEPFAFPTDGNYFGLSVTVTSACEIEVGGIPVY